MDPDRQQKLHPIFEELAKIVDNTGLDIMSKLARLAKSPDLLSLQYRRSSALQTALTCFRSGQSPAWFDLHARDKV
ncbi:hypothetical protein TNCV_581661 [Trichonephila clavipes]|nr:hypothetical protein TNCV_581661 [Trichonephila clavipes]